jgi:uncharacterized protein YgiM (DUF1202 family)
MTHIRTRLISLITAVLLGGVTLLRAQDTCNLTMTEMWTIATAACIGKPDGYLCNGGSPPQAEPAGPVSSSLASIGALVEVGAVDSIRTPAVMPETGTVGVAWLRRPAPVQLTALMIGDVSLRDVSPPDFPPWQSMVLQTGETVSTCSTAPHAALLLQSPLGQSSRFVVNGVSLILDGTIMAYTTPNATVFLGLSGLAAIMSFGQEQPLWAGQQISIAHPPGDYSVPAAPPLGGAPFDPNALRALPIALLDRPVTPPQPGTVTTLGAVNLRVTPDVYSAVLVQVQAGEVLAVLGRNPAGDWLHVRRTNGETGWMLAELLGQNLGVVESVYESTPLPPQRYGELGSRGRVLAPDGVNLRVGPDLGFNSLGRLAEGTIVNMVARSPYSPWVKVEANGLNGWVALVTLETQAFIDALPIDFGAPLPPATPTPTRPPGSFGNAFPDPNNPGD